MKRSIYIVTILLIIGLSGCIGTKIYLGGDKREIADDTPIGRAIDPTSIPAGGTWGSIRTILNTNLSNINGTLDSVEVTLAEYGDSITNYSADIQLRLLKSDTASMLGNYTRNGELNSALAAKVNVSDTAAMLSPYALTSELGDAGIAIGDVRDEIADSLNVLRPLYVAAADTAAMLNPYAKLTDLSEGGIGIGAVQKEIADSLNVLRPLVIMLADTTGTAPGSYVSGYTFQEGMSNKLMTADSLTAYVTPSQLSDSLATVDGGGVTLETVQGEISDSLDARIGAGIELSDVAVMIADSTGNAPGNYVTHKALVDSINANLGGAVGITLNSGTITLTGDGGTADDITFYTNGDGSYDLPAGGGNLTIMSQVQGWISDTADVVRGEMLTEADLRKTVAGMIGDSIQARLDDAVAGIRLVDSTGNAPGNYVTYTRMVNYVEANAGSAEGITLNSGTLTLTGDEGTADDVTFYTNGDGSYNLPAGGGNLTIMSEVQGWISDTADVVRGEMLTEADLRKYDSDTITLFVFGAGSGGAEADTALFTTSNIYGSFYNAGSDTLIITNLRAVMIAGTTQLGTDTLAIQVYWNDTLNVALGDSYTVLNTSPLGINSTTVGTTDTSFDNSAIPPNRWVWCKSPGVVTGRKPKALVVQLTGFKRNRSY